MFNSILKMMNPIFKTISTSLFLPLFPFLFLFPLSSSAQEYPTKHFPKYGAIVSKFYSGYVWSLDYPREDPSFEKRKEGWYVSFYQNNKFGEIPVKTGLFWSAKTRNYVDPGFKHRQEGDSLLPVPAAFKDIWSVRIFNEFPYQGYMGWDKDVIQELDARTDLNDTLYFALAKAWSNRSTNLMEDQTVFPDPKERFTLPEHRGGMSAEQLEKYLTYHHRAIACFEKVKELNPRFETMIGNIGVKVDNEYMSCFLELLIEQGEKEALKEIPEKRLYDELYDSYARNQLSTCAKNGILLTNGDNDTYPLLYAQVASGFRRDVRVANTSLLKLPRYINLLRDSVLKSPPVELSLNQNDYRDGVRDFLIVKEENQNMELSQVLKLVTDTANTVKSAEGYTSYYLPSARIMIPTDPHRQDFIIIKRSYLYKSDLIVLDMLSHSQKRPLYFITTLAPETFSEYNTLLTDEGLAYHVKYNPSSTREVIGTDRAGTYNNFINKFEWKGLDKKLPAGADLIASNFRFAFIRLARSLLSTGETDSATVVFNKALQLFPDETLAYDAGMYYYTEFAYMTNKPQLGLVIARKTLPNITTPSERKWYLDSLTWLAETNKNEELKAFVKGASKGR
jgi:hypothetical protein